MIALRMFLLWVLFTGVAGARELEDAYSEAAVFASVDSAVPGEVFTMALEFTMKPGWHTYAEDPGDSGMPPDIRMDSPEGVVMGAWQFPPAHAFTDAAGTTYGYENRVVLLSEVRLPSSLPAGNPLVIKLDVMWMVCLEMCIPLETELELELPVGKHKPMAKAAWRTRLKAGGWPVCEEKQRDGKSRKEHE